MPNICANVPVDVPLGFLPTVTVIEKVMLQVNVHTNLNITKYIFGDVSCTMSFLYKVHVALWSSHYTTLASTIDNPNGEVAKQMYLGLSYFSGDQT